MLMVDPAASGTNRNRRLHFSIILQIHNHPRAGSAWFRAIFI